MSGGQKIRAVFFYLCVCVFILGLPYILSYSLGYKFNFRTLRFIKTGLIVLKTQPSEAEVYLNGKLLKDKTPVTINELLPGKYNLLVKLEEYYSWSIDVNVEAGKVLRFEEIILFSAKTNIKQLNKEQVSSFWVDQSKQEIYYFNQNTGTAGKSDLDGQNYEDIDRFIPIFPLPEGYKLSSDRKKIAYFNQHKIGISYILLPKESAADDFILNFPGINIRDIFWYSNDAYIIIVTDQALEVLEARPGSKPIILISFNKNNPYYFYDVNSDTFFFLDSQTASDGKVYDNVYKIDLSQRMFNLGGFEGLIKHKVNDKKSRYYY
ncbi:MAG: PEGA domain-containing protein [Candidatus Omnitrophota bacterium]